VRVGLPRNMVRPLTDPHGSNTDSVVTTPVGRGGRVVVVVVLVEIGGSVVTVPSGSTETTFAVPATHALASIARAIRRGRGLVTVRV